MQYHQLYLHSQDGTLSLRTSLLYEKIVAAFEKVLFI